MQPISGARLTCVTNFATATYSGMLPGVLAGQYSPDQMEIDLVRLCAASGARLIVGEVTGIELANRRLTMLERPAIPYDALSIGIGSVPTFAGVSHDGSLVPIKPMQTLRRRLEDALTTSLAARRDEPLRIVVVGGGVGGVEIAFALPNCVRRVRGDARLEITLVAAQSEIPVGAGPGTVRRVRRELERRGVRLEVGQRVARVTAGSTQGGSGHVQLEDGRIVPSDLTLWATTATAPPLLGQLGLPADSRGFLLTHPTLQSTGDPRVLAVGDAGTIERSPTPKAGVYAVRQGPILWQNLRRLLADEPLVEYRPQRQFLKLINTADGCAIGEWRGFSFAGKWCWQWKDRIDRRFMAMYQDPEPMAAPAGTASTGDAMRCLGCGGKVSGSVLSRVLSRLDIPRRPEVLVGLDAPDDAALLCFAAGTPLAVTVDFFAAPLDDAYLVGRVAAQHAASDLFAVGARPVAALALATLPVGPEHRQEQLLEELLSGSLRELREMGATLVGGHTIEGPQLTIGFTMIADQGTSRPRTKNRMRPGEVLILTKPLGTGILLAAHMRARCQAAWMATLVETMLRSNQPAARLLDPHDIAAATDVTGFGLAGHLLEMLAASQLSASLDLDAIPLLPGVAELIETGIESTLAPANRAAEQRITVENAVRTSPAYAALFDPQTSGGLLLSVPASESTAVLTRLHAGGDPSAVAIGRVFPHDATGPRITIS